MRGLYLLVFALFGFVSLKAQETKKTSSEEGRLIYSLNGENWSVVAASPGVGEARGYYNKAYPVSQAISAKVPGDIYWNLMRADKLPDIFIGMNVKKTYALPLKEWWYHKSFTINQKWANKRIRLNFAAVDYAAKIWINGQYLGSHEGQFTPFGFDVTDKIKIGAPNDLTLLIEPAPDSIIKKLFLLPRGQLNRQSAMDEVSSKLKYWKSRTMTGWDWGTPLWSMGIWQDVTLNGTSDLYLNRLLIYPETHKPYDKARLKIKVDIDQAHTGDIVLAYKAVCINADAPEAEGSQTVKITGNKQQVDFSLLIKEPALWWPNGAGAQNLYKLIVTARDAGSGEVLDCVSSKFGIREIKTLPNPDADNYQKMRWYSPTGTGVAKISKEQPPKYLTEVNGRPIFLHGGNWLPADLLFGRPGKKAYEHLIRMAVLANYNAFRVWGGGLIEKQVFYDLCDQYGILVFQEMPNAGARPLETQEALASAAKEQRQIMPLLINHPAVFRYGFGNELYITRKISLQEKQYEDICKELDPTRFANGADPVCEFQRHGPHWFNFPGEYSIYDTGYPLTIGPDNPVEWTEYGASGIASVSTLKRIIPGAELWPISSGDSIWKWHNAFDAYMPSNWLDPDIYKSLFGELPNLETEVEASQFAQAEGLRYANQSQRRAKWHRSGCFMWTFNEPWPNAAHGSIVEYYGLPKMALYYTQNSYAPIDVSAVYHSMSLHPGDTLQLPVYATNAKPEKITGSLRTVIIDLKGNVHYEKRKSVSVGALSSAQIDHLSFITGPKLNNKVLLVRFDLFDNRSTLLSSETYTFGIKALSKDSTDKAYLRPMLNAPETKLTLSVHHQNSVKWKDHTMLLYKASIINTSKIPALFVKLKSKYNPDEIYFKNNYFVLFPGENKKVDILVSPDLKNAFKSTSIYVDAWNIYQ